eukprot:5882231-Prymnesium_polylepis.1
MSVYRCENERVHEALAPLSRPQRIPVVPLPPHPAQNATARGSYVLPTCAPSLTPHPTEPPDATCNVTSDGRENERIS